MSKFLKILLGIGVFVSIAANSKNKETKKRSKKFLFIGDSLTLGFGLNNTSYVDLLNEKYPNIIIKKIAITGKQTGWMLQQLKDELATGTKYDVITIWGGINDIYAKKRIDGAKANIQNMFELALLTGAKVVALNVIPTKTFMGSTSQTVELTNQLNSWFASTKNISIIDVSKIVSDGNGGTKTNYLQKDYLHLNDSAQIRLMYEYMDKIKVG